MASLDGFIADDRDDVGPLHDWYFNGDHPLEVEDHPEVHSGPFRVSAASVDYVSGMWSRQGAVALAQELAGEAEVGVAAGDIGGQALSLGLIDYVAMDLVPAVFGSGKRYFGSFTGGPLVLDDPDIVIQGERVLHLRYPVRRGPASQNTHQEES